MAFGIQITETCCHACTAGLLSYSINGKIYNKYNIKVIRSYDPCVSRCVLQDIIFITTNNNNNNNPYGLHTPSLTGVPRFSSADVSYIFGSTHRQQAFQRHYNALHMKTLSRKIQNVNVVALLNARYIFYFKSTLDTSVKHICYTAHILYNAVS